MSLSHVLVKHRCPTRFGVLFIEFGGRLWQRDVRGLLATDLPQDAPCKMLFQQFLGEVSLTALASCPSTCWQGQYLNRHLLTIQLAYHHLPRSFCYSRQQDENGGASLLNAPPSVRALCPPPCFGCTCTLEAQEVPKHHRSWKGRAGVWTTQGPPQCSHLVSDYSGICC